MSILINFDYINQKLKSGFKLRFDIGLSNDMPNSLEWLEKDEDVFVVGIEPHPNNFQCCKELIDNSKFKDRCFLIESAIDDVENTDKKVFYGLGGPETNYDAGTSSLRKPIGRFKNSIKEVYNVNVISLNYILDNLEYHLIDLIKTDTQGNDLNVLKSLKEHIKKVIYIHSEYDESSDYKNANTGSELDDFLLKNNFEKYDVVYQPLRENKIEDCKYKNLNYIS